MAIKEDSTLQGNLREIKLSDLVEKEYKTYQLYSLYDRAIPYLVDGLKPSQRRILYILWKNMSKGLMKVTSATGQVVSLHPHGPASIESAIVNMAQDYTFSNNYPLIDKKGYFGERMETQAAAGRYIECKLSKMAEKLLFDDINQVTMVPNYDEKILEPEFLLPKLPIMLLNGSEGIGTGYSSLIPSFHHKDIIDSMIQVVQTGKAKKLKPWFNNYEGQVNFEKEKGRFLFPMRIEKINGKILITELPRGYDASKIYGILTRFIDEDFIKDYIDSSKKNTISIELVFRKGQNISVAQVEERLKITSSMVPNYTLISEKGVEVFNAPEEIIEIFTHQRIAVVKKRYELLVKDSESEITKNNEIIRFIKQKHYAQAEKKANRSDYINYLKSEKFTYFDYLADMAIYRMTKEEVAKRELLVTEKSEDLKEYKKVFASKKLIEEKLVTELHEINDLLNQFLRDKAKEK